MHQSTLVILTWNALVTPNAVAIYILTSQLISPLQQTARSLVALGVPNRNWIRQLSSWCKGEAQSERKKGCRIPWHPLVIDSAQFPRSQLLLI